MEKKILITGASGFIGGKLFKRMQGPNLFGTANSSPVNCENIIKVDLADSQATKKLLEGLKPAVIFHFAGMASPKKNDENPEASYKSHIHAVENILNNVDRENCHLIFLSTDKVFDGRDPCPDEKSDTNPSCLYGELKLKCEDLIAKRMKKYHILRLSVVHSNGSLVSNSVIDSSILKIMNNEKVRIFRNVARCFADLDELITAFENLMDNSDYGVYHYGSKLMSYHDRLIDICERDGVDFEGRIEGVDGQAHPLVQNFDTSKFRSLNL